jgi:Flp pilus assembly protein TadG
MTRRCRDERGTAAVETVVGVPAFLLLIALVWLGARVTLAEQAVQSAATEAARSASLARTAVTAREQATAAATMTLVDQRVACVARSVTVDTAGFAVPVGSPARVSATVRCTVDLSDLGLPVPGRHRLEQTAVSPLDTFRARR